MKNGDQRSERWIREHLKKWKRDNSGTYFMLSLIGEVEITEMTEIFSWTDVQCMLAEDWAANLYFRASDNINRVPAMPEFLKPYGHPH